MIAILGMGGAAPETTLSNDDLSKIVETNDEWIVTRTGMRVRHIAKEEGIAPYALASAREALDEAGVRPEDLGFILCATVAPDRMLPGAAATLLMDLGASCPALDVNAACSGFLYALYSASRFYDGRPILVVGCEKLSGITDYSDRASCVLFGDGAAAAVIGDRSGSGLLSIEINAYPDKKLALLLDKPSPDSPAYLRIKGQEVYKFASRELGDGIKRAVAAAGLTLADIDHLVPHQANLRIIEKAVELIGFPMDKVFVNIEKYGNTSAASCPLALWELWRSGKLKRGDIVALTAFGGGLTSGAAVLRW